MKKYLFMLIVVLAAAFNNFIFANNIIASYPAGNELVSDAANGKVKELDITKVESVNVFKEYDFTI